MSRIKHAIIMAAGRGSRMMPLTAAMPKAMAPYGDSTLIAGNILNISKHIPFIHVTVGYKGAMLAQHVIQHGVSSIFNTEGKSNCWWIYHTLLKHLDEPIIVLTCDNVTELDFGLLESDYFDYDEPACMIVPVRPVPGLDGDYIFHREHVVTEVNRHKMSDIYCSGIQVLNPVKINTMTTEGDDFYSIWNQLISRQQLIASRIYPNRWFTVDTLEQLTKLSINQNNQEKSISEMAEEIRIIEAPTPFQHKSEIHLGDTFIDSNIMASFVEVKNTKLVRNFVLGDVILLANILIFYKNCIKIPETKYLISDLHYEMAQLLPNHTEYIDDQKPLIIGYNMGWTGYYHWLVQCVPAIDHSARGREGGVRVATPKLNSWQKELLDLLNLNDVEFVEVDFFHQFSLKNVEYSEFLNGSTVYGISTAMLETFERLTLAAGDQEHSSHTMLYVARTDTQNRHLRNEDELISFLEAQGVKIVIATTLKEKEKINLFKNAKLVIGPHGSGLSNIAFCREGSILYELFPYWHVNPCYFHLAQAKNIHYWADRFAAKASENLNDLTWELDIETFKSQFHRILKDYEL